MLPQHSFLRRAPELYASNCHLQLWFCTGASLPSLCGESPSARDPHSEPHLRSVKNFALVCVSGPLRDGLGARQLAFRPETHNSPVAKKNTVRTHT